MFRRTTCSPILHVIMQSYKDMKQPFFNNRNIVSLESVDHVRIASCPLQLVIGGFYPSKDLHNRRTKSQSSSHRILTSENQRVSVYDEKGKLCEILLPLDDSRQILISHVIVATANASAQSKTTMKYGCHSKGKICLRACRFLPLYMSWK